MNNLNYREDIDGLRAIAVLIVVLFHLETPGFGGGYIGVDIFFVISGYLITPIIINQFTKSNYNIIEFYIRRIRRIFPALIIINFSTIFIAGYIYLPREYIELSKSLISSGLFFSNVFFWRQSGYFDNNAFMKPLLHTWSLSIEEQFYLFFPIFLLIIFKLKKNILYNVLILLFIISFLLNIWGIYHFPSASYYLTPMRAWEILIGSILSFNKFPQITNKKKSNLAFLSGILLIIFCVILFNEKTLFPGYNAIFPVLGSLLIIHSGNNGGTQISNILKNKILVFIGKISYPLYLWHWPIICFYKYLKLNNWSFSDKLIVLFFSFILAYVTWKFIEKPIKEKKIATFIPLCFICISIMSGLFIVNKKGMPSRINSGINAIIEESQTDEFDIKQNKWEIKTLSNFSTISPTIVGKKNTEPTFALIGDSHARSLIPAFDSLSKKNNVATSIITMSGTPPFLGISINNDVFNRIAYNNSVLNYIKNNIKIKTIILEARWSAYYWGEWVGVKDLEIFSKSFLRDSIILTNNQAFEYGLELMIDSLILYDKEIIILTDVPEISFDVPSFYWLNYKFPSLKNTNTISSVLSKKNYYPNELLNKIAKKYKISLINIENQFFNKNKEVRINDDKHLYYRDNNHLSLFGAIHIMPVLDIIYSKKK